MQVGLVVKGEISGRAKPDLRRRAYDVFLIARPIVSSKRSSAASACLSQIMDLPYQVSGIDLRKHTATVTSGRGDIYVSMGYRILCLRITLPRARAKFHAFYARSINLTYFRHVCVAKKKSSPPSAPAKIAAVFLPPLPISANGPRAILHAE